ncbi:MAG: glycoside hydrolase family 25 protein [Parasporobacterium sp.]|nr:glycoside hydrolase family 25 protein [Parasporobacterium sp.]
MKGKKLVPIIVGALLAAFIIVGIAACAKNGADAQELVNPLTAGAYDAQGNFIQLAWYPDAKMNDFEDENWVKDEDGFFRYTGPGYETHKAIDVSSNQDVIDWERVKAAGIEYAIMRTGYRTYGSGIIKTDETCYWNLKQAKKAGLKVGVYFFSQAINEEEAREEAEFVLDQIHSFDMDLPVYFDTEEINYDNARTDGLSGEELTNIAIAFCEYVKEAGYTPGIYANQMWLCNKLDLLRLEQYDIWLAKYAEELNYPYEIQAWQFSSEGRVDGIGPAVDLDVIIEKK